jgi:hypothetical protein
VSKLDDAAEEVIDAVTVVVTLREDLVIKRLITAFRAANFAKFDPEALLDELNDIANDAAFDSEGFPLDSTDAIVAAAKHRFKLQALRDRLISITKRLREAMSKVARTYRLALVNLRQNDLLKSMTVKAQDEVVFGVLREIADVQDSMKLVKDSVQDALTSIDDKTKTLDAWFALHKQYVFMTANRGPKADGDEEATPRRLGKRPGP